MTQKELTLEEWEKVDKFLMCHCSVTQAARAIGISDDTLRRRIKEKFDILPKDYKKLKASEGKSNLKVKQYEMAMEGDKAMAIWLGKQWLKQSDKSEVKQDNKNSIVNVRLTKTNNQPITSENDLFDDD
jgi:IS30 family transposase